MSRKMHIFEDGSIGYTETPEGFEQDMRLNNQPAKEITEVEASDEEFAKMREKVSEKIAVKNNKGKYVIRDR
jgi:hypothetical protein